MQPNILEDPAKKSRKISTILSVFLIAIALISSIINTLNPPKPDKVVLVSGIVKENHIELRGGKYARYFPLISLSGNSTKYSFSHATDELIVDSAFQARPGDSVSLTFRDLSKNSTYEADEDVITGFKIHRK